MKAAVKSVLVFERWRCVKAEVAIPNSPCGLCGCKAALNLNLFYLNLDFSVKQSLNQ